jgi:hypothetical protein
LFDLSRRINSLTVIFLEKLRKCISTENWSCSSFQGTGTATMCRIHGGVVARVLGQEVPGSNPTVGTSLLPHFTQVLKGCLDGREGICVSLARSADLEQPLSRLLPIQLSRSFERTGQRLGNNVKHLEHTF